ncbi:MAG: aminotransferase, partial [Bacteroidales bacterium]|nr:aminotransferase [Bacteroidales bacterium]
LCEVLEPFTSTELVDTLLQKNNILLKDCSKKQGFNGKNYVRIAVRNHHDNDALIEILANIGMKLDAHAF